MKTAGVLGLSLILTLAACGEDSDDPGPGAGANTQGGAGGAAGTDGGATGGEAGTGGAAGNGGMGGEAGTGGAAGNGGTGGAAGTSGGAGNAGMGGQGGAALIDGLPVSPLYGTVVFNEVLTDGTAEGDPNGDGDIDPVEDQFVEFVNVGAQSLALDGFTLVERDFSGLPRHTFGPSDSIAPGSAIVVFGGGDCPDPTATTTFYVANAADPGLPFGLDLSLPLDTMWLLDDEEQVVARFCYGATGDCALDPATDQSLTRSPDITGDFVPHTTASGADGAAFSVGTRVDGTPF